MSLTLGAVITSARNQSPFYHKSRGTPDKLLADVLGDYQNDLIGKAVLRDKSFLSQTATVALNTGAGDDAMDAGAGSPSGLPGDTSSGSIQPVVAPAGRLVQVGVTAEDGATVVVPERVATSATSTSITSTGAARATNVDAGLVLVIVQGTGAGQFRQILSNTAEQWVISSGTDGRTWSTVPDASSMFTVVRPAIVTTGDAMIVDELPALESRPGYLVRLDASGNPFIDYVAPLVASVDVGIALPAAGEVTGGKVFYNTTDFSELGQEDLVITTIGRRLHPPGWPAVYTHGGRLYFCGGTDDWTNVASLQLEYTPVTPDFAALTDLFLLPDTAKFALVARAALTLAQRTAGQGGTNLVMADVQMAQATHAAAEAAFLARLGIARRARMMVIREG